MYYSSKYVETPRRYFSRNTTHAHAINHQARKNAWLLRLFLVITGLCYPTLNFAFHIVGGEITYQCLSGNNYQIRLTVYRDCYCTGCAEFDNPAYIAVYDNTSNGYIKLAVPMPTAEYISPPEIICAETLPDICVHQVEYVSNVVLPPTPEGYTLVYQRYSRNQTVANLVAPSQTGSSYTANIPPTTLATCNDSPTFNSFPPTVICANTPIYIDQSATDSNGDSLVYSLCDPLIGGTDPCPQPGNDNTGCPDIPPPPYDVVTWAEGYSADNPLGGSNPLSIDPQTGWLSGIAPNLGQYVVGICVEEYRNGLLIGTIRRDFQFNVADCTVVFAAAQADSISAQGDYYITDCSEDFTVQFINNSIGGTTFEWDFGVLGTNSDISTLPDPAYQYPDTGTYNVQLIAYGPASACADTAHIILKLYPVLQPTFSYIPQCANVPIAFTDLSTTTYGQITDWQWLFDGNIGSYEQNPSYAYPVGGTYNVTLTTTTDLGCVRSVTQPVTVYPAPDANFSTTAICPGVPVSFSDETTGANVSIWQWDLGNPASPTNTATTPNTTQTYEQPGTYTATLTVTTAEGCTDTQIMPFTVYNYFTADAGPDVETCIGIPVALAATDEYSWFSYEWSPAMGLDDATSRTPNAAPPATTTYTVVVSDPNGCTDTDAAIVTVYPLPSVSIVAADSTICEGSSATLTGIIDNSATSYAWSGNGLNNNNSLSVAVLPTEAQNAYSLDVINQYGCTNSDTAWLYLIYPVVASAMGNADICEGDTVQLSAAGGDTYLWQPAFGLSDPDIANPTATPNSDVAYTVTVANECFDDTATVHISVRPMPVIDAGSAALINVGESTTLTATSDDVSAVYQYVWSPALGLSATNLLNPIAAPLATTTYLLTALSPYGCAATDSVRIEVTNIFRVVIPNAFSPNGDGTNDQFGIIQSKGIKTIRAFRVYNRWGQVVFDSQNDPSAQWDGKFKGLDQEMGTYVFFVDALTFLDEPYLHKGNLTLIR